ncbi:tRNA (Thr-GGU) A37 N-methylase [Rhizobium sp. BIGb0125]|jgi:hypothetical protein|nr:tRNA (Thr-GGU) A37 N-methylase [Rhizobium sp. BIGb0125]
MRDPAVAKAAMKNCSTIFIIFVFAHAGRKRIQVEPQSLNDELAGKVKKFYPAG